MLDGLLDPSPLAIVLYALALTHVTIAAVTIYLHRHSAHRALALHPAVAHFFRFWLWLTTGMVTREWTAVHRRHHARCETAEDPHSPQVLGLARVLLSGAEIYRSAARDAQTLERYGKGTPDDWLERKIYTPHHRIGIALLLCINLLLLGPIGLTVWAVQMIWIPLWAAGVINGVGHAFGYRNYATPDASANIVPWGVLIGGEELHNNHHAHPGSARFSARRFEFDIGWFYIRLLAFFGLVRVKRVAPPPLALTPGRVDMAALVGNRLQVIAGYARVLARVYREERRRANRAVRRQLRRVRRLLAREELLLDGEAREHLAAALAQSPALATAYQYGRRLREVWSGASQGPEQVRAALADWCRQAEGSGIRALADFARDLRGGQRAAL